MHRLPAWVSWFCDGKADVAVSVGIDHIAVSDTVSLRWFR